MSDPVNHPAHYQATVKGQPFECLDLIEALLSPTEFMGYLMGNVHKYTFRYKNKNGLEDLKKARFYLDEATKRQESKKISRATIDDIYRELQDRR